jgi:ribosomal protein S18 acetylase RimI-like enzyme
MKKFLLILLLARALMHAMDNDLKLVPFDTMHEAQVARIYQENFSQYPDTFSSALLKNYAIKIALVENTAMGLIIYKDAIADDVRKRYIHRIAIDKPYQRRHYGTQLMTLFEKQSRKDGIHVLRLGATGQNNSATRNTISFYTNLKFKSEAYPDMIPLHAYATLGSPGLNMIKELDPQPSCWSGLRARLKPLLFSCKTSL